MLVSRNKEGVKPIRRKPEHKYYCRICGKQSAGKALCQSCANFIKQMKS